MTYNIRLVTHNIGSGYSDYKEMLYNNLEETQKFADEVKQLERVGRPVLLSERMIDTLVLAKTRFPGMPNSLDALCRRFAIDLSARTTHNALLDCRLLADVYVELTGGRQRGFALAAETAASEIVVYTHDSARTPRPIVPNANDLDESGWEPFKRPTRAKLARLRDILMRAKLPVDPEKLRELLVGLVDWTRGAKRSIPHLLAPPLKERPKPRRLARGTQ